MHDYSTKETKIKYSIGDYTLWYNDVWRSDESQLVLPI
ncbi:hypothetical protein L963_013 [Leuconostoc mesenteroides subsp. cremoris T26]|nr:hypothetical protein L963_013 [Leuconostoc mesenteroides subsp. cremoris T26]